MVGEPFILPDHAHELTESERALILVVIDQLLAKRAEKTEQSAPVISLRHYKATRNEGDT